MDLSKSEIVANWQQRSVPLEQHPQKGYITYLARQCALEPIVAYHLFLQGINTPDKAFDFLYPSILNCHDPFLLNEMRTAIVRIIKALKNKEKILIFGDYDCDGITASTIMYQGLRKFGANVSTRLPLRSEGYGLSPQAIKKVPEGVSLIITVDNGSSAHPAMKEAKVRGIDVIVTDHHEVLGERPDCLAFINPKRSDNTYPFTSLSGAGVALKVIQALFIAAKRDWVRETWDYIELVTLGTIADLMPLIGENRILCWAGLYRMRTNPNPSFRILLNLLKLDYIDSTAIGFSIGPIFNACGRIADPNLATAILQNPNPKKEDLQQLIRLNEQRKIMTKEQVDIAIRSIERQKLHLDHLIVVHDEFHHGIIGILASKIVERYKKPTIVISKEGTGSARTVNGTGFSIIQAIQSCEMYLKKFGGHQAAAGLSIEPDEDKIQLFRETIQHAAKQQKMQTPVISYISELPVHNFPSVLFDELMALEPFGMKNPKPVFCTKNVYACSHAHFGKAKEHVRFHFSQSVAYAYSKGDSFKNWDRDKKMDILYSPNSYKKKDFLIRDCRANL